MTRVPDLPDRGAWTHDQLLAAEASGQRLKFVAFWSHLPPSGGSVGAHVLSQWFEHRFESDGVVYQTAEQMMMAEKARLFGDRVRLEKILSADSPGAAKALGRHVEGFEDEVWNHHRQDIVTRVSVAKFGSSEVLRDYLVGTGNRVLVEASPRDRIWGIGLQRDSPDVERPSRWQGLNLLGFALMAARARLGEASR